MLIAVDIPDELAGEMVPEGTDASRFALELLAIEGYRTKRMSEGQIKRLLGYRTRMQVHALLAAHDVCLHYSVEDLDVDAETSRRWRRLREDDVLNPV
jgi:predicted HTH domain antitoxin